MRRHIISRAPSPLSPDTPSPRLSWLEAGSRQQQAAVADRVSQRSVSVRWWVHHAKQWRLLLLWEHQAAVWKCHARQPASCPSCTTLLTRCVPQQLEPMPHTPTI
jgi:hypothetical protein